MKVNALTLDPTERKYTTVSLDGEDVGVDCMEADDVEGYVILLARDAGGNIRLDEAKNRVLLERVDGVVKIGRRQDGNGSNGPGSSHEGG